MMELGSFIRSERRVEEDREESVRQDRDEDAAHDGGGRAAPDALSAAPDLHAAHAAYAGDQNGEEESFD